jgi:predicted hydrocarbon binding protein
MEIKVKSTHDSLGDKKMVNAYFRWALMATEEVAGKQGLGIVLRENGLERFIDNYPPEDFTASAGGLQRDYAAFCTGLLSFFGRAGRGNLLRIGRRSARLTIDKQMESMGIGPLLAAARLLPTGMKLKAGLETNIIALKKIYKDVAGIDWHAHIEDRGDKLAYVIEDCPLCIDHEADITICTMWTGLLSEIILWFLEKEHDVQEVECRAQGAKACVWEISKTPKV